MTVGFYMLLKKKEKEDRAEEVEVKDMVKSVIILLYVTIQQVFVPLSC